MTDLFYWWLAFAVLALIVEMFSGTLYGLSFSLSAFLVAAYVAVTKETDVGIVQALIFALTGAVFCFVFPAWFNKSGEEFKQGLDAAVGKSYVLKRAWDEYKITIDGVDYPIDHDCVTDGFAPKKKATVVSHSSWVVNVVLK